MSREGPGGRDRPAKGRGAGLRDHGASRDRTATWSLAHRVPRREVDTEEILLRAAEAVRLARRRALQVHDFVRVGAIAYQLMGELLLRLSDAEQRDASRSIDLYADAVDRIEQAAQP